MPELLPTKVGFILCVIVLGLIYIFGFVFIRFEALPKIVGPHLTILFMYAIFIGILVLDLLYCRRETGKMAQHVSQFALKFSWTLVIALGVIFIAVSVLCALTYGISFLLFFPFLFVGIALGLVLFCLAVWQAGRAVHHYIKSEGENLS